MKVLRIIPYFYLFIAILFVYDVVDKFIKGEGIFWLGIAIAAVAVFMFFFRKKSVTRMEGYEQTKNNNTKSTTKK
ncbi:MULTISPECIES: hypothetical protein [Myroides]|uniref:Uncharacterized protein n=1 Tax=Myroides albus TaxID=2562892 RepID=A0A6I3LIT8_9FLAO|nr:MULTISPECIES: hypothetical protein [Myroides]MTG97100.1 hypothetical protein [Myroides albus]MVX36811.1 hypothetical protein [Myroides sp. LoEW2-1]UVD78477.1 hypothetical protein NWE55_10065 [Myroides albus]